MFSTCRYFANLFALVICLSVMERLVAGRNQRHARAGTAGPLA